MDNNEILKKLRVALHLRNEEIIEILELVDFKISKGALGDLFRKSTHPSFVVAGDQIVRNFLNGLIIHKRGRREEQKKEAKAPKVSKDNGQNSNSKHTDNKSK